MPDRKKADANCSWSSASISTDVAWPDHPFELHFVGSGGDRHLAVRCVVNVVGGQQGRSRLHRRLAEQDAGSERIVGVMSAIKPFVAAERLATHDPIGAALDDLVQQQEWFAMRDQPLNLFAASHPDVVPSPGTAAVVAAIAAPSSRWFSTSFATITP